MAAGPPPAEGIASRQQQPDRSWQIEQVAEGVWAALQPAERRFDDSNAAIILAGREVIVVDAQSDAESVRGLIGEIGRVARRPVRYLVATHWHADHTQGATLYHQIYGEGLLILGHASLLQDVPGRAAASLLEQVEYLDAELPGARERLRAGVDREGVAMDAERRAEAAGLIAGAEDFLRRNRDAAFLPPDLVYRQEMLLRRGGRRVELLHFTAHTRGDTVVYLPDDGVLITGDVLDDLPYAGHGYPRQWVRALEALRELEFDTVIPGHGPVYRGKEHLDKVLGFLRDLVAQVQEAVGRGLDLEATTEALDLQPWREALGTDETAREFFDQVLPAAVERAWLEARGELPD